MIQSKRSFLYGVTQKTVLILFALQLGFFIVYVVGNFRGFQDATQFVILQTLIPVAILNFFFCIFCALESVIFYLKYKNERYLFFLPVTFILALASVALAVFSNAVKFFAVF